MREVLSRVSYAKRYGKVHQAQKDVAEVSRAHGDAALHLTAQEVASLYHAYAFIRVYSASIFSRLAENAARCLSEFTAEEAAKVLHGMAFGRSKDVNAAQPTQAHGMACLQIDADWSLTMSLCAMRKLNLFQMQVHAAKLLVIIKHSLAEREGRWNDFTTVSIFSEGCFLMERAMHRGASLHNEMLDYWVNTMFPTAFKAAAAIRSEVERLPKETGLLYADERYVVRGMHGVRAFFAILLGNPKASQRFSRTHSGKDRAHFMQNLVMSLRFCSDILPINVQSLVLCIRNATYDIFHINPVEVRSLLTVVCNKFADLAFFKRLRAQEIPLSFAARLLWNIVQAYNGQNNAGYSKPLPPPELSKKIKLRQEESGNFVLQDIVTELNEYIVTILAQTEGDTTHTTDHKPPPDEALEEIKGMFQQADSEMDFLDAEGVPEPLPDRDYADEHILLAAEEASQVIASMVQLNRRLLFPLQPPRNVSIFPKVLARLESILKEFAGQFSFADLARICDSFGMSANTMAALFTIVSDRVEKDSLDSMSPRHCCHCLSYLLRSVFITQRSGAVDILLRKMLEFPPEYVPTSGYVEVLSSARKTTTGAQTALLQRIVDVLAKRTLSKRNLFAVLFALRWLELRGDSFVADLWRFLTGQRNTVVLTQRISMKDGLRLVDVVMWVGTTLGRQPAQVKPLLGPLLDVIKWYLTKDAQKSRKYLRPTAVASVVTAMQTVTFVNDGIYMKLITLFNNGNKTKMLPALVSRIDLINLDD